MENITTKELLKEFFKAFDYGKYNYLFLLNIILGFIFLPGIGGVIILFINLYIILTNIVDYANKMLIKSLENYSNSLIEYNNHLLNEVKRCYSKIDTLMIENANLQAAMYNIRTQETKGK